jgi:single-strand DNA-binding protein
MNKVILMGRLCADPEFKQTPSGTAVCRFRVAVNRKFANKQTGEREADFISCTAWKNTAEFISRYFRKGSMITVEGSLRNNDWTDQNNVKHYSMDVSVDSAEFCGDKNSSENAQNGAGQPNANYSTNYPRNAQNAVTSQQNGSQAILGDMGDFEDILSDGDTPF